MQIRQAKQTDVGYITDLVYSSGSQLYDFIYQTDSKSAKAFIEYEFLSGRGFCGFSNMTVAVLEGQVVATGCFYSAQQYTFLVAATMRNMIAFYGLSIFSVLLRSAHIGSVMKKPVPASLYLSNFGVSPHMRGNGIGTGLIKHKIAQAKTQGYTSFTLDVADNNPRAKQLYERLGMQATDHKVFTGKRKGYDVPNATLMHFSLN